MTNNRQPPDMPSPDDLRRATAYALKNSKWASGAVEEPRLSDEDKARMRLEEFVVKTMKTCSEVKRLDEEKTGLPFDEVAMSRLVMSLFQDFTNNESKEALRFMLSMVHTGLVIDALKELP